MSKYRFKTKEEFIRDKLWDEKDNCPYYWNYDGEMNEYLGIDVPDECIVYCNKNEKFKYDGWLFQNTDYTLKEQQKYFPDLSQHIGRYIRALVDNPHSGSKVKKGDIGKIINRGQVDFPNRKSYSCSRALSKDYLGVKYELLPEDYSPEQNIEFIPGKWYKLIDCENAYRKCSRIPVENRLPYSELIGNGSYRCETGSSRDLTRIKLLEDLSEIQEYLPDGHPDKIGSFNFEVGKWYNFTTMKGKYNLYVKVASVTDRNLFFMNRESISDGYLGEADCIDIKLIENPRLVEDLSEIQKYLPDGHPDKIGSFNFEVGKWYKFLNGSFKFGKYEKIHNSGNRIKFSEIITSTGIYDNKSAHIDFTSNIELLTDLSEIQKYLPNGHPDKVKNFKPEVGKWYSFNWDYSGKDHIVIAKIKKVEEDYFAVSWRSYLWLDKSYSDSDAYRFKDVSNIKELSIKEIQPYLPIGHPDKITSSEFKKGEYIVLIDKGQSTGSATLLEDFRTFIQNHCYKVRENSTFLKAELDSSESTTNGWVCIPYNPNQFHKTRNWRYATQEEIDEYERRGKPYDVTELNKQSFPDEGSIEIEYIPKNLMSYLENNNRKSVSGDSSYNKEKVVIAWNKSSFWFCSVESSKPKYSKDFIEKIIGQSIYSNTILEAKKELSMKEIQEECKRRFPIGCTFIPVGSSNSKILKKDSYTYSIVGKQIWAHSGAGYLYENGKWAKLVSLPKQNDLKEEAIKYSEETNATILLASNIKSKELHSTYGNTSLSVKLLSNKTTHLINNVREISSVNLKIK